MKLTLLLLLSLFLSTAIKSQVLSLETDSIRVNIDATKSLFNSYTTLPAIEYPKNSANTIVHSAGFILSVVDSNNALWQAPMFKPYEFKPGPLNSNPSDTFLLKIKASEINDHRRNYAKPNYVAPVSIRNWPARGDSTLGIANNQAPFFDANQNGCYDPQHGDYPIIKGDEAIYSINHYVVNDFKVEIHSMLYAYNESNDVNLNNSLFLQYRVINRGAVNYDFAKIAFFTDADIHNRHNDYVGCDSTNSIFYTYNSTNLDSLYSIPFDSNPPVLGVKFLTDSMSNFMYYNVGNTSNFNREPELAIHWLTYSKSIWTNGAPLRWGEDGTGRFGASTDSTNYIYTGDPLRNTGWTELNPIPWNQSITAGDRSAVGSIAPFEFRIGEEKMVEVVLTAGKKTQPNNYLENIEETIQLLNKAKMVWDTVPTPTITYGSNVECEAIGLIELNSSNEIIIFPNPAKGIFTIRSTDKIQEIQLFSVKGKLVKHAFLNQYQINYDISDLPDGIYLVRAKTQQNKWVTSKIALWK
jgi:hypothetical protein